MIGEMESNQVVWVLHVCDGCHSRNFECVFASKEAAERYAQEWFMGQGEEIVRCPEDYDDFDGFCFYNEDGDVYAEAEKVPVLQ